MTSSPTGRRSLQARSGDDPARSMPCPDGTCGPPGVQPPSRSLDRQVDPGRLTWTSNLARSRRGGRQRRTNLEDRRCRDRPNSTAFTSLPSLSQTRNFAKTRPVCPPVATAEPNHPRRRSMISAAGSSAAGGYPCRPTRRMFLVSPRAAAAARSGRVALYLGRRRRVRVLHDELVDQPDEPDVR